jgi:hypothetical protein
MAEPRLVSGRARRVIVRPFGSTPRTPQRSDRPPGKGLLAIKLPRDKLRVKLECAQEFSEVALRIAGQLGCPGPWTTQIVLDQVGCQRLATRHSGGLPPRGGLDPISPSFSGSIAIGASAIR